MMDKYDDAIAKLLAGPPGTFHSRVWSAWCYGGEHLPLFDAVSPSGEPEITADGVRSCGCLTQVKGGREAYTPELTAAVRADDRIPAILKDVTRDSLHVFAEWQRRIDREIRDPARRVAGVAAAAERNADHGEQAG